MDAVPPNRPAKILLPLLTSSGALLLASLWHFLGLLGYPLADRAFGVVDFVVAIGLFRRTQWARRGFILLCSSYLAGMITIAAYTAQIYGTFAFGIPDHASNLGKRLGLLWTGMSFLILGHSIYYFTR